MSVVLSLTAALWLGVLTSVSPCPLATNVAAISFCPVSAGLFFGSLIPLTLVSPVSALLVMAYGVGTALPVAVVAVLLVSSVQRATRLISSIESLQPIIIMFTAGLMIVIGLILTMESLFGWTLFG